MHKAWAAVATWGIGDNLIAAQLRAIKKARLHGRDDLFGTKSCCVLNNPHIDKLSVKQVPRDMPQGDPKAWQRGSIRAPMSTMYSSI